jgi:hypothetical protein
MHHQRAETRYSIKICMGMFVAALLPEPKGGHTPMPITDGWVNKMRHTHTVIQ